MPARHRARRSALSALRGITRTRSTGRHVLAAYAGRHAAR